MKFNFISKIHALASLRKRTKVVILVMILSGIWFWLSLPATLFNAPTSYILEDKDGNLLNAMIAEDGQWRFPPGKDTPKKFEDCIVTYEDKRFFYHPGIDPAALARALIHNIKNKTGRQGGSTLTMQVVRLWKQNNKRNIWNKATEGILALRLECSYSKKEILNIYAANAPFGGNVVGLEAAAWRYYGRNADNLSWGEMAALAVLPNAPALVHPGKNREILLQKRNSLLDKLEQAKTIDAASCALAKLEPLPGKPNPLPQLAPHLFQRFKKDHIPTQTTRLKTTIDPVLQLNTAQIIQQQHNRLKGNGINNLCALVMGVETGEVLAYIGNVNDRQNKETEAAVDIIAAPRSPGSALKPVLYTSALHDGLILPHSLLPDIPMQVGGYAPKNFELSYDGAVPADRALARSLNIPAVKLLMQYKYTRFYETLKQAGITTLNQPADHYGLSLILGGCEVTLWDMAGMYASMARALNHQSKNKGKVLAGDFHPPVYNPHPPKENKQGDMPMDAVSLWYCFNAMQEVMRPGEEGLWQQFGSSQNIAWKTGTSFGFRDAWAIGVTPKYVVAVWAGNADGEGRPGLIGVQAAAPVMFDIFRLLPASGSFEKPGNAFAFVATCRQSGFRAGNDCDETDTLMVPVNGLKSPQCPYHKIINVDATGMYRVTEACESPQNMQHKSWFILSPAMEYYYRQKNAEYKPLPPFKKGCGNENTNPIEIIYPQQNAKIYVPLEMSGEKGKTIFTAAHRNTNARIFWSLDDKYIATTQHIHQLAINPSRGSHIITLVDEYGNRVSRSFEIIDKD